MHAVVRFAMFLGALVALTVCCSLCRSTKTLFMASSMGEHLFAFGGIGAFYNVQELLHARKYHNWWLEGFYMLLIAVGARLVCIALFQMTKAMRKRLHSKFSEKAGDKITDYIVEAENQGSITMTSFLLVQAVIFSSSGVFVPLEAFHGGEFIENGESLAFHIFVVGCCFVVCHCLIGCLRGWITNCMVGCLRRCFGAGESISIQRSVNNFLEVPGMSISWCFLRSSLIAFATWFPQHRVAALVVNAAMMYGISMLVVLVLDKVADAAAEKGNEQEHDSAIRNLEAAGDEKEHAGESDSEDSSKRRLLLHQLISTKLVGNALDAEHHATVAVAANARATIRYLSLLVGLCWEKAWEEADEVLLELPFVHSHPVVAQTLLAILMLAWTGAAWYHYIVRMAILSPDKHKMRIENEKEESESFAFDPDAIEEDSSSVE